MDGEKRADAVRALYEMYHDRVVMFARRLVEPAAAEDVAQEVFVRLLHAEGLDLGAVTISYLIKMAENQIRARHRRNRRYEPLDDREDTPEPSRAPVAEPGSRGGATTPSAGTVIEAKVGSLWASLTQGEQDAIRLIVCQGLSYQAAANALHVQVSTVNNWKFRALQRLKGIAAPDAPSPTPSRGWAVA